MSHFEYLSKIGSFQQCFLQIKRSPAVEAVDCKDRQHHADPTGSTNPRAFVSPVTWQRMVISDEGSGTL